jgi:NAD(P)-dependent dehydrogenase (short-subunit alcohol dehydrogenase family)
MRRIHLRNIRRRDIPGLDVTRRKREKKMAKQSSQQVVLITGASSGIGKATALEFARRGASLVLAARRVDPLDATAAECAALGARALTVPTDVSDESSVARLAAIALETFGRIDVWINNAAVGAFGRFTDMPAQAFRRVIETNFFGYVHGARSVMPIFQRQGYGVLINNASTMARLAGPYYSAYAAAKHAVRALGMSLREEMSLAGFKDVHVCTVMPGSVDTPFFQHSANYTGREVKPLPPVYPAAKVAKAMADCAVRPRREFFVGNAGRVFNAQYRLSAAGTEEAMARAVDKFHLGRDGNVPATDGNLFKPLNLGTTVEGGWTRSGRHQVDGGTGNSRRIRNGLAATALAAAGAWIYSRRRPRGLSPSP